jgi:hypothetical protein
MTLTDPMKIALARVARARRALAAAEKKENEAGVARLLAEVDLEAAEEDADPHAVYDEWLSDTPGDKGQPVCKHCGADMVRDDPDGKWLHDEHASAPDAI